MKRDVFYIAGYDPRSYRFYYKLYKENLKEYNKISNQNINITNVKFDEEYKYFNINNNSLNAKYTFLEWHNIVKQCWFKNSFDIFKDYIYVLIHFIFNFQFVKFYRVYKNSLITGFYPAIMLTLIYIFMIICTFVMYENINNIYIFFCFFICFIYIFDKVILFLCKKFAISWLLNIFVFSSRLAKNKIKNIDYIINKFVNVIFDKLNNSKNYELILISHSVGTIINIMVLCELIKKCERLNVNYQNLKIITLGECIPMCSLINDNSYFMQCLKYLSDKDIFWVDFTSKIDGACFYLIDFFKVSGVKSNKNIIYLSSAFYKLYDKTYYKKIIRKWYKVHFLYLFATHYLGQYDFFAFSASDKKLEEKIKRV
ncbi:DUF829 domain-containing protein [Campylobacter sp. MG1]|uniref:DUF829 domain-containing protein n=1 Tax=Campylobacter sp. MG1 TaxID=2976332 RepID=UPI00226CFCAD|nr:DUF829 domain-containing protein [Campylobacter sp. MG1]